MTSVEECRRIIALHSKSFSLASKLLSPAVRDDAVGVYAWCRRADDAVDLVEVADGSIRLSRLRAELADVYSRKPTSDPVLTVFGAVVERKRIPLLYPNELLAGMEMDLVKFRYADLDELLLYCYRVAGVVGLMMCHVLGVADDRALIHGAHLGAAMQLTNIARDVAEDRLRGRVYLPRSMMSAAGQQWADDPHAPLDSASAKALAPTIRGLLETADHFYKSADAGLAYLDRRSAIAIATARKVYADIGRAILKNNCDPSAGRAFVSKSRKWRLAGAAFWQQGMTGREKRPSAVPRTPSQILDFNAFRDASPCSNRSSEIT